MAQLRDATSVFERLDRMPVTALHALAIGLCAAGFTFDLLEIALGSVLSAVFSTPPHSAMPNDLSLLLASVYIGAVLGSPVLGRLADRYGRRVTLMAVLLLLTAASFGAAFCKNIDQLIWWRGLAGLALGGYPPLMIAYLTDLLPPGRRGSLIFVAVAIGTLGPGMGVFLVRALVSLQPLGMEGWRWGFIFGGVGAGVVGMLMHALPESPRWLQARGRYADADAACQRFERARVLMVDLPSIPMSPSSAPPAMSSWRRWALLATLFFLSPWSTTAFPLLSGAILAQKGFRLSDTLLFVGLSTFGPLVGNLVAAITVDHIGRRTALTGCAILMTLSGYLFVISDASFWLIIGSFAFGLFVSVFVSILNLYGAELFPTASRATAIAGAWTFNRIGAALAPLVLLPLLGRSGPLTMFMLIIATLALSVALLAIAPPGRQRHAVG